VRPPEPAKRPAPPISVMNSRRLIASSRACDDIPALSSCAPLQQKDAEQKFPPRNDNGYFKMSSEVVEQPPSHSEEVPSQRPMPFQQVCNADIQQTIRWLRAISMD
jgi:hypothetical protein